MPPENETIPNTPTIETPPTPTKTLPFNVGADPEFLFFHGTRALDASEILSNFLKNQDNMSPRELGFYIENLGEVGWDGAASTGEFRPIPSHSPSQLTERINQLVTTMYSKLPAMELTTLSIGSPIGGHIHIEIDKNQAYLPNIKLTPEKTAEFNRIEKLIATYLMPIIASEHRLCSSGRMSVQYQGHLYGKADDFRWEERGNNKATIEIRGISAEWLTTPKITNATLAYTAVITNEIFKKNQELIKDKFVLRTKNHIQAIQELMLLDYAVVEKMVLDNIKKTIKKFELYPIFKEEIDYILNPQKVLQDKKAQGWNMVKGWNLNTNKKQPTKKELFSKKTITNNLAQDKQIILQKSFDIPYNDDYNISLFAKAITDRVTGLNWNLKNEYFLYGLKKGITGYSAMDCQTSKFYTIPTNAQHAHIINAAQRMLEKFEATIGNTVRIDPKTGTTRQWGKNQIVIGIPYEPRTKNETETLIELIWNIENNKIQSKIIDEFPNNPTPEPKTEKIIEKAAQKISMDNQINITPENLRNAASETIPTEMLERELRNRANNNGTYISPPMLDIITRRAAEAQETLEHHFDIDDNDDDDE